MLCCDQWHSGATVDEINMQPRHLSRGKRTNSLSILKIKSNLLLDNIVRGRYLIILQVLINKRHCKIRNKYILSAQSGYIISSVSCVRCKTV